MAIDPKLRLLLISTSTVYGTNYLDHAEEEIRDHLKGVERIVFVPYALLDHDAYAKKVVERFQWMGIECDPIHTMPKAVDAVNDAQAVFIGGGNTFRLLKAMYDNDIVTAIRKRALGGMPYMGASAGSNVACPTIRTTNDMPIVQPTTFDALNLLPWQLNPHYMDPDMDSTHMGETREQRLQQYLEENERPVIGLREGSMLRVREGKALLRGIPSARVFVRGKDAYEIESGSEMNL